MPAVPRGGHGSRSADTQLRAQPRPRHRHDPRQARRAWSPSCDDWEELRLAGAAIKDAVAAPPRPLPGAVRGGVTAAGGRCTGRATRPRPTGSSPSWSRADRRRRGGQGQVDGHPGDRAQRGARRGRASPPGDRPGRADRPARRRPALATSWSRRSTATAPRSATSSCARWPTSAGPRPPTSPTSPRALAEAARAAPAAEVPARPGRRLRARTSPSPRPAPLVVVESEGNGRMCLTLPETLITVHGHREARADLAPTSEVFLQLLPRSSTGERMNPYTSMWTGVTPGDGPQEFHLVLLDNGRTDALADPVGPPGAALHPLLGLPERLPGVRAHRRARLRLGLPRPDRRDPDPAAARGRPAPVRATPRCPTPRRCAGPASTSARCASTSRRCWSTCAARSSTPRREHRVPGAEAVAMAAAGWAFARPGRLGARSQRLAGVGRRLPGDRGDGCAGPAARAGCRGPAPGTFRRRPRESFRAWWRRTRRRTGVTRRASEVLARIRRALADGPTTPSAPSRATTARSRRDRDATSSSCSPSGPPTTAPPSSARRRRAAARHRRGLAGRGRAGGRTRRVAGRVDCELGGRRDPSSTTTRRCRADAGRGRRRAHRLRGGDRRDRHDRAGRRPATRAGARSPWCPTTTCAWCAPTRSSHRAGGRRPARPGPPADLDQRAVGDQRHRARPGRGRTRAAHAAHPRRRGRHGEHATSLIAPVAAN